MCLEVSAQSVVFTRNFNSDIGCMEPVGVQKASQEDLEMWDAALVSIGLSMENGNFPGWLSYGHEFREASLDSQKPFNYSLEHKPTDQRGGARPGARKTIAQGRKRKGEKRG